MIESVIDRTYELLFCLFFMENSPILEMDQLINVALGRETADNDRMMAVSFDKIVSELYDDNEKSYEIGSSVPLLSNFRLLSKAHTERLDEADLAVFWLLKEQISPEAIGPAKNIVEKTYKEIMCVDSKAKDRMTCLGPFPDESFCFDDDSIVFGLVIDETDASEEVLESIRDIAKNMKEQLFPEISTNLDAKIQLFVSI